MASRSQAPPRTSRLEVRRLTPEEIFGLGILSFGVVAFANLALSNGVPMLTIVTGWLGPLVGAACIGSGILLLYDDRLPNWRLQAMIGVMLALVAQMAGTFIWQQPGVDWAFALDGSNGGAIGRAFGNMLMERVGRPAAGTFKVIDVSVAPDLAVGYIVGVGDAVPQAIEQLGVRLELIDADELAWGDLDRFDVIVTGVRAYERREDLRANNDRLLEYVENGGVAIVQYNKFEFNQAQYGPLPAEVSRNRVTDERAPVRVIAQDHPAFAWPNRVGAQAWSGWVQERGLYFLGEKDPAYVDLVELEDSFEWNPGVKRGALVELQHGGGRWLYVGLGLWRQLPAGTPGAYQLLANLLSLGAASLDGAAPQTPAKP